MDLDFVIVRPFEKGVRNFAGEQSTGYVANGMLAFGADGFGHELAQQALEGFVSAFQGDQWGSNGPDLVTRVVRQACAAENAAMAEELSSLVACQRFRVYGSETFYAIPYVDWERLFNGTETERVLKAVNGSMAVHMHNKMSADQMVKLGEGSTYERMALEFCPAVMATVLTNGGREF